MKVLVACEFSGAVRRAFSDRGHDAWSCDLLASDDGSDHHFKADALHIARSQPWDLMIAHPPCTYLTKAGARWMRDRLPQMEDAIQFVRDLLMAPIPKIALENPSGVLSRAIRPPDQTIQPWQFGHGEVKGTCLWLIGLPRLRPTNIVKGREPRCHREAPGPDRWKRRSRTLPGIAQAMAAQWGNTRLPAGIEQQKTRSEPGLESCVEAAVEAGRGIE